MVSLIRPDKLRDDARDEAYEINIFEAFPRKPMEK